MGRLNYDAVERRCDGREGVDARRHRSHFHIDMSVPPEQLFDGQHGARER
jgi:hypothetical protein